MTNNYARAYTEVLEILSHFSDEEYSKIPIEKIEFYKKNMDKGYIYMINPEIDLSKQVISDEANAILPDINITISTIKIHIVNFTIFSNVSGLVPKYDNAKDSP